MTVVDQFSFALTLTPADVNTRSWNDWKGVSIGISWGQSLGSDQWRTS